MSRLARNAPIPPSPTTPAATGTARSAKAPPPRSGSPTARPTCCRCRTITWCSRCLRRSPTRTRPGIWSTVKYPEALDREQETAKLLQLDLPEIGASTSIFLQIRDRDSLESQAVILCWRKRCVEDLMRPRERRETGEQDMFRSRLDQVIDMDHALAKLARTIDWGFLEEKFGEVYKDGAGQPPLPTRLMAGLAILKHTYNLSDEAVCERW